MAAADNWKQQIKEILTDDGNTQCADCNEPEATWAVHNIGVFVCIKCSGVHRQLGVHVSKVKSTEYDKWTQEQLDYVRARGNTLMNSMLEANLPRFVMRPGETPFDSIRFSFIQDKYANRLYANGNENNIDNKNNNQKENKMDENEACNLEMPMKIVTVELMHETKRKKLYFQLLTNYLYYFRYAHDSYDFEHYDVTSISMSLIYGGSKNDEPILEIKDMSKNGATIFRLRSSLNGNNVTEQHKCLDLSDFCQKVRRATLYYGSDVSNEQKFDHEAAKPKKEFTEKDLKDGACTVLGFANKKGGGARNWRKRWWILDNGILYYFKEDFRQSKKNKVGVPQGEIGLLQADITWDRNKKRTNKDNALLICTHKRTFYIQPNSQNAKSFFEAVESCCEHMWNRHNVNFATLKSN